MTTTTKIHCPQCNAAIDVQDVLTQQLAKEYQIKYEKQFASQKQKYAQQHALLEKEKLVFEEEKRKQEASFLLKLEQQRLKDKKVLETQLKQKYISENEEQLASLKEELDEKTNKIRDLNKATAEVEKLKREKDELKTNIEVQVQEQINKAVAAEKIRMEKLQEQRNNVVVKELQQQIEQQKKENQLIKAQEIEQRKAIIEQTKQQSEQEMKLKLNLLQEELQEKSQKVKALHQAQAEIEKLKRAQEEFQEQTKAETEQRLTRLIAEEKERITRTEQEKNEMKFKEYEKQLADQKKLTEEMQRKHAQGSMQLQGEVQEIAIEQWLHRQFPQDEIVEIKKGARGGDCIQQVQDPFGQACGSIYYESKRTKEFQPKWIEKFKGDIREKGADMGVLVTEVMPSDMDRMGMRNGIWICNYAEFKGICFILRQSIVDIHTAQGAQENKTDKMHMLYDYLTSNTFRMQVEAIVEGFSSLQTQLEKEQRAMQKIWKQREIQIKKVLENTATMYGSIKGIAGNAVLEVKALELEYDEEEAH